MVSNNILSTWTNETYKEKKESEATLLNPERGGRVLFTIEISPLKA